MRLVIADTGPINYLCLDRLHRFASYPVPEGNPAVRRATRTGSSGIPPSVRYWISTPPLWVEVAETPGRYFDDESLKGLDQGEQAAIALASAINADLLLMDDREGVMVARAKDSR